MIALAILGLIAFSLVGLLVVGAITHMDRKDEAEVLRILAASPHPMPGAAVCKLLSNPRPGARATIYTTLARLEDRGLVERIVGPAYTASVGAQVYTLSGIHSFRLTDAGRAALTPPGHGG